MFMHHVSLFFTGPVLISLCFRSMTFRGLIHSALRASKVYATHLSMYMQSARLKAYSNKAKKQPTAARKPLLSAMLKTCLDSGASFLPTTLALHWVSTLMMRRRLILCF